MEISYSNRYVEIVGRAKEKEKRMIKKVLIGIAVFFVFVIVVASLTGKDTKKSNEANQGTEQTSAPSKPQTAASKENNSELKLGETFKGSTWSYTVYGVREADTIDEQGNQFMVAKAGPDEKFVIVDFGIKNITQQTQIFSSIVSNFKIRSKGGFTFDPALEESAYLKQTLSEGQINPGLENRGGIVFKIRKDATELKFDVTEEPGAIWALQ